ncbi:hypothetical protein LZ554_006279 [Drepanopeziza brunnea f. sp. 'monogermtubi']|nr:hypothetical protein LZ554_006279 [Drepanopeziza brunnea f. sp. 'monogermtubi']
MDFQNDRTSPAPSKRLSAKRRPGACEFCKTRKVKCDGKQRCSKCVENGNECIYLPRKKRSPGPLRKSSSYSQSSVYSQSSEKSDRRFPSPFSRYDSVEREFGMLTPHSYGITSPPSTPPTSDLHSRSHGFFNMSPAIRSSDYMYLNFDSDLDDLASPSFGVASPPTTPPTSEPLSGHGVFPVMSQDIPAEDYVTASQMYVTPMGTGPSVQGLPAAPTVPLHDQLDFWATVDMDACSLDAMHTPSELPDFFPDSAEISIPFPPRFVEASQNSPGYFPRELGEQYHMQNAMSPVPYWGVRYESENQLF